MIRKIQAQKNMRFVFIPGAYVELLGLKKGQKVDVRIDKENIIVVPIPAAKRETGTASALDGAPA